MKSERRHELQQNELAAWLARVIELLKPYSTAIVAVLLLASLLALGITLWSRFVGTQAGKEWDIYFAALNSGRTTSSDFEKIAENSSGNVKYWAIITASDRLLTHACDLLFTNKDLAKEDLHTAEKGYKKLLGETTPDVVRERATIGLARTQEALGDIDEAVETYERLQTGWPKGAYAAEAADRIAALKTGAAREFRDRFAKSVMLPPVTESRDISKEPLEFPSAPKTLGGGLKLPDLTLPPPLVPSKEAPASAKPPAKKPAIEKPTVEKPAAAKPQAAKSAPGTPPVGIPAADKPADAKK